MNLGRKWQLMTDGPYRIMRKVNDVNYVLQRSSRSRAFVTHIDRMTLFEGEPPTCWRHLDMAIERTIETAGTLSEPPFVLVVPEPPTNSPTEPIVAVDPTSEGQIAVNQRPNDVDLLGLHIDVEGRRESPESPQPGLQNQPGMTFPQQDELGERGEHRQQEDLSPSLTTRPKRTIQKPSRFR